MPRTEATVTSRMGAVLMAHAHAKGLNAAPLLAKHQLGAAFEPGRASQVATTLPVAVLRALAEDLAALSGDPHFGLEAGRCVPRGVYGLGEFLLRSVATLQQAFEGTVRYSTLLARGTTFRFTQQEEQAWVEMSAPGTPTSLGRQLNEASVALLVGGVHKMEPDVPVVAVRFANPRPADTTRLEAAFPGAALQFDRPTSGFAIPVSWLSRPTRTNDPSLAAFLKEQAEAALANAPRTDDVVERLKHALEAALQQGEPNIERLAKQLHLSGRTLQRRLADHGTTFQEVLDGVRFALAQLHLGNPALDVSEVAFLLGYSELRAFDRAFKRWSGTTPREWRSRAR